MSLLARYWLSLARCATRGPFTAFQVDDIQKEYARLKKLGVEFTMEPTNMGMTTVAVFNDTCGNLIQIYQVTAV